MGVVSFDEEATSKIAPARLFKASVKDSHNLIPKIAPTFFKNGTIIQGDGGAGTIKQLNMAEGVPYPFIKHRIDEMNEAQCICKYSLIEGGELNDTVKSISYEIKLEPSADGGSICKLKRVFHIADGAELDPKQFEGMKAKAKNLFEFVEAYLLANPNEYA